VKRLVILNIAVYAAQVILGSTINQWLGFTPALAFRHPWTWVTHMFAHGSPMHILFNMIVLYFFGSRVESRLGASRFLQLYFVSGFCGALLSFILAYNSSMWGASGAIYGVMLAFAAFWPRAKIYIWGILPVEAWLLVVATTLFSLFSGLTGANDGTAHFAHLGGYVGAWIYLSVMERFSPAKSFRAKVAKVAPHTEKALKEKWQQLNLEGVHQLSREEVNRILDKINSQGIASLTSEEKLFLSNFVPPDDRKSWVQ